MSVTDTSANLRSRALRQRGTTVFLTTHYMAEAEELCDRVAFINDGQIGIVERPRVLTHAADELRRIEAELPIAAAAGTAEDLRRIPDIREVQSGAESDGFVAFSLVTGSGGYGPALQQLAARGAQRVTTKEPTLEDVYVRLIGERGMRV